MALSVKLAFLVLFSSSVCLVALVPAVSTASVKFAPVEVYASQFTAAEGSPVAKVLY